MTEPDLTSGLDAAEAVVMHGATVKTEWGYRDPDPESAVFEFRNLGEEASRGVVARRNEQGMPTVLVRCTVTYGPWEEVPAGECEQADDL